MAVQKDIDYELCFGDPSLVGGLSVWSEEFDQTFAYTGDDLGCTYSPEKTKFRFWAPTASEALLILYEAWDGPPVREIPFRKLQQGTWLAEVEGDLNGTLYTYKVKIGEGWNEAVDPYARTVSVNGDRGAVIDLTKTNPECWTEEKPPLESHLDTIIYEVNIRDLSVHPQSGIRQKGKFLGACETGTVGPKGTSTGLDYIRKLGVTHVQLLPIFDFSTESLDETKLDDSQYNWGYDPKNFNVPEGTYATDPYDPACRIRELKQLIQACHDNGIRVIMDVVYNHLYDGYRTNFTQLVPGYYFRYQQDGKFSNGSGCGNDTASERRMMRKFILDSVVYWAKEYHIDGFRFDLMGLHDIETMNTIKQQLHAIDPSILIIGEGWNMATTLPDDKKANQINAAYLPGIGQFNDGLRDGLKGTIFWAESKGFVNGAPGCEWAVKKGIAGSIQYNGFAGFALEPVQTVNYAECHDNYTLWDKLAFSNPEDSEAARIRMHLLATAIILTSQGIAFLHAGQEFMRTKKGVENSFMSPDDINRLDWQRCAARMSEVEEIKGLIAMRKSHPAFRMPTADLIRSHLVFEEAPANSAAFTLRNHANGDPAKHLFVVHNANPYPIEVKIPLPGPWSLIYGIGRAGPFDRVKGGSMHVASISTVVLAAGDGPLTYFV